MVQSRLSDAAHQAGHNGGIPATTSIDAQMPMDQRCDILRMLGGLGGNYMLAHRLGRRRSLVFIARFLADPLLAVRDTHGAHGPFLRIDYPHSTRANPKRLFVVADTGLCRTLLSGTENWLNVQINMAGRKNHASSRLVYGMTRLRGQRHEHYRKMFLPPLKRSPVLAMAPKMASIAESLVDGWPVGVPLPLTKISAQMAKHLAIGLLFGDDSARGLPVADMIGSLMTASWIVPGPAYVRWILEAPKLERAILTWAAEKRGNPDAQDILALLANNFDEAGNPPSPQLIGGIISFFFGAAYDTCLNALSWTTILLTQHPAIMARLVAELDVALDGGPVTMDALDRVPLLESAVREAMRLFPPVPLLMRKAAGKTTLGGEDVKRGERVLIGGMLINRDPSLYPQPDCFNPDRWSNLKPSPFQYLVFGAGGHMCPGTTFGYQMMRIALATILTRRAVELPDGLSIGHRLAVTHRPHGKVEIILRPRGDLVRQARANGRFRDLVTLPEMF